MVFAFSLVLVHSISTGSGPSHIHWFWFVAFSLILVLRIFTGSGSSHFRWFWFFAVSLVFREESLGRAGTKKKREGKKRDVEKR